MLHFLCLAFGVGLAQLPGCKCRTKWTSPEDGGDCVRSQYGCPAKSCVAPWLWDPWCITANAPCAQEEKSEGGGWHYCDPDADEVRQQDVDLPDCKCKTKWTSPEDGGNCAREQNGCEDKSCVAPWEYEPWCITANAPCKQERFDEGGGWHYCDPDKDPKIESNACGAIDNAEQCREAGKCNWTGRLCLNQGEADPDNLPTCQCKSRWTSPEDGGNCSKTQSGCPAKSCVAPWLWDPWCITANAPCKEEEQSEGGGWHYCAPDESGGNDESDVYDNLPDCQCLSKWSTPEEGGNCDDMQYGCPAKSCVAPWLWDPWCMTANAPCKQEEQSEGGGWHYCEPSEQKELPTCKCKDSWTSPEDGGNCARTQNGCPSQSCVAPWLWKPWCITANAPCKEERQEDGGGWHYCTQPGEELPKCKCKETWTSPEDGGNCGQLQRGCEDRSCVSGYNPWCMTANAPCKEEEFAEGGGWHYCKPGAVDTQDVSDSGDDPNASKCKAITKSKDCKRDKDCAWLGRGKDGECFSALNCATGKNKKKCRKISGCEWDKKGKKCFSG